MIFLKINCPNFSRLVWRRHTKFCHTASGATDLTPALAADHATSEQLTTHAQWPPLIDVKLQCHLTAEIAREVIRCEIVRKSFDDIKHIEHFPVKIGLFWYTTRLIH